jgi:hypothetical protein
MKTVLLLCPNDWDADHLARSRERWAPHYAVLTHGDGAEHSPATFDALSFVEETVERFGRKGLDGVCSSSDYPGCLVAAAVAHELGLPGPAPRGVLMCSHKYYSRVAQAASVPDATPGFGLVDDAALESGRVMRHDGRPLEFPVFVKPVKSWFSQYARRCETMQELRRFATSPEVRAHLSGFVTPFNQLLARYTDFAHHGGHLLAEECLSGTQVTLEGYVHGGKMRVLGIVDSVMYPGTMCFQRFDYPSRLPEEAQRRMIDVAERVIPATGLDETLFNVELFWEPESGRVSIIEINPRMCGQFADLYEMVLGTNTYEILFALATRQEPPALVPTSTPYGVAASFPLRHFENAVVKRVPSEEDVAAVKRDYPLTILQVYYREGQRLSDEDQSDGYSYRYAVFNLAAPDHATLLRWGSEIERRLGFEFESLERS